jgi:hypothetical protein
MSPQMPQRPDSSSSEVDTRVDLFQGLTQIPGNIFDTFFGGEPESKEAISEIVNNRIVVLAERRGISEWALCEEIAERTDLELSVVLSFIHGTMDLGDSLPLTILQAELGVRLCDL